METFSAQTGAQALLRSLAMAEMDGHRSGRWDLFESILVYIRRAGDRLAYLDRHNYALKLP